VDFAHPGRGQDRRPRPDSRSSTTQPECPFRINDRPVGLHPATNQATQAAEPARVPVSVRARRGRDGSGPLFVERRWLGGGACDAQLRVTVAASIGRSRPSLFPLRDAGFSERFAARSLPNKTGMCRKTKDLRKCDRTIKDLDASCPRACIGNNGRTTKEDSLFSAWSRCTPYVAPRQSGVLLLKGWAGAPKVSITKSSSALKTNNIPGSVSKRNPGIPACRRKQKRFWPRGNPLGC